MEEIIDKILLGKRLRYAREDFLGESTKAFAERVGLSERYIGQIERGEFLIPLHKLAQISSRTNIDMDFFVFGKHEDIREDLVLQKRLHTIIDRANPDELKIYYNILTNVKNFEEIIKENEKNKYNDKK